MKAQQRRFNCRSEISDHAVFTVQIHDVNAKMDNGIAFTLKQLAVAS